MSQSLPPGSQSPDPDGNPLHHLDTTLSLRFNSHSHPSSDPRFAVDFTLDLNMPDFQEGANHADFPCLIDYLPSVSGSESELLPNSRNLAGSSAAQNNPDLDPGFVDLNLSLSLGSTRRSSYRGNDLDDFRDLENSIMGFDWGSLIHYESEALSFPSLEDLIRSQRNSEWEELCEFLDSLFEEPRASISYGPLDELWSLDEFIESVGYQNDFSERENEREHGILPAAKRVVESLPLVELKDVEVVCAVCGEEVVEGEMVNRLPCRHYYHGGCIVPWLKIKNTCPLCRYEFPTEDEEHESRCKRRRIE